MVNYFYFKFLDILSSVQYSNPGKILSFNPLNLPNQFINDILTKEIYSKIFTSTQDFIYKKQNFTYSGI